MHKNITPLHVEILKSLAKFRFLTNSQLVLLQLGHINTIRKATKFLTEHPSKSPLLDVKKNPLFTRLGKMENVFFLSKSGVFLLQKTQGKKYVNLQFHDVSNCWFQDYDHRRETINFHIQLENSLKKHNPWNVSIGTFENYFDKTGANHGTETQNLNTKTKIDFNDGSFFIPDSVFILQSGDKKNIYTLETVMGDKKLKTLHQIEKHIKAISEGVVGKKYGIERIEHVPLFQFQDFALMQRVGRELFFSKDPVIKTVLPKFYFATIENLKKGVQNKWRKVHENGYFNFINGNS